MRNGEPVHVRAQVIDLLTILALRSNEIVLKEEVSAALWPGVHVSKSALSRCMTELRQVFEDDAEKPWLIETVAKRGYRLIAPVVIEETELVEPPPAPPVETTEATPAPDAAPAPTGLWTWIRQHPTIVAVGLAAILVMAGATAWWLSSRGTAQPAAQRALVVLGDVVNTTGDSSLGGTLRLALAVQLQQAPFLQVVSDARIRETLGLMKKPLTEPVVGAVAVEACQREGAAAVLTGSIARLGSRFAFGIEVIRCRDGESLAKIVEDAQEPGQLLEVVGRAASTARTRLGESRASLASHDVPPARSTTASLEALRAVSVGDAERREGRVSQALELYRRATEIDPQFAVAWARQGSVLSSLSEPVEAAKALTKAYGLASRTTLPEGYYITSLYHLGVTGDIGRAAETLQAWKRQYPGTAVASVSLASILANVYGRFDEALKELDEAARSAPPGAGEVWLRLSCLRALGRLDEARRLLDGGRLGGEFQPGIRTARLQLDWMAGKRREVHDSCTAIPATGNDATYSGLLDCAGFAALGGRVRESRRLFEQAAALASASGDPAGAGFARLRRALVESVAGNAENAERDAQAGLALMKNKDAYLRATMALALAGRREAARVALDGVVASAPLNPRTDAPWTAVVRAAVETLDQPGTALDTLRAVQPDEHGLEFALMPIAARAVLLFRAGQHRESVEACREFLRWQGVNPSSPMQPLVAMTLARALAAAGDTAKAREAFNSFLEAWKDADSDLPLLKAARAELAALPS